MKGEKMEQLSLFPQEPIYPCMSLDEMRQHEWVVSWSGGKDSTATVIKMHELGVPIKFIVFVLMMWDEETPAILPIMYDFVLRAKEVFEEWGYRVLMPKSRATAKEKALQVFKSSSYENLVGTLYGCRAFLGGGVLSKRKRNEH